MAVSQEKLDELLMKHLSRLSRHFRLWIDDDYRFVIVGGVLLPPGYNVRRAKLLIELPGDYPLSPPGIGDSLIYVSPVLQFHGYDLKDLHPHRAGGQLLTLDNVSVSEARCADKARSRFALCCRRKTCTYGSAGAPGEQSREATRLALWALRYGLRCLAAVS